jgi:hypothetical protein
MKKSLLLFLILFSGCSKEGAIAPSIQEYQASVTVGSDVNECVCYCIWGVPPNYIHCRWKVFPHLLEESQGNSDIFEVGIDFYDLRKEWRESGGIGCVNPDWAPIERAWMWITYDPTAIELLEINPGIDNEHWRDEIWMTFVDPFYEDPSRNLIRIASGILDDNSAITQPIMNYGQWDRYRFARLVFRQLRQSGDTWIEIFKVQDPMRCDSVYGDLQLILNPIPRDRKESEL